MMSGGEAVGSGITFNDDDNGDIGEYPEVLYSGRINVVYHPNPGAHPKLDWSKLV